jgi:hypothetical protein
LARSGKWAASGLTAILPLVTVAVITAGCSSDNESDKADGSADGTKSTEADPTTTTTRPVEDDIVARYEAFWEARFAANSPPNPDDLALQEYATGEALVQVVAEAEANRTAGVEFRRRDDPSGFQRVEVLEVSGDTAVVQECVVDDALLIRTADGAVLNDAIGSHNMRGEMRRVDGEWRLARSDVVQRWDGEAGCVLAP